MASIENKSRFVVTVQHRDDLTKTFAHSRERDLKTYVAQLKAQGYKPKLSRTNDNYIVRVREAGRTKQCLPLRFQRVDRPGQLVVCKQRLHQLLALLQTQHATSQPTLNIKLPFRPGLVNHREPLVNVPVRSTRQGESSPRQTLFRINRNVSACAHPRPTVSGSPKFWLMDECGATIFRITRNSLTKARSEGLPTETPK
jgi:hypothetical protein